MKHSRIHDVINYLGQEIAMLYYIMWSEMQGEKKKTFWTRFPMCLHLHRVVAQMFTVSEFIYACEHSCQELQSIFLHLFLLAGKQLDSKHRNDYLMLFGRWQSASLRPGSALVARSNCLSCTKWKSVKLKMQGIWSFQMVSSLLQTRLTAVHSVIIDTDIQ